jgi:hypothetical protein
LCANPSAGHGTPGQETRPKAISSSPLSTDWTRYAFLISIEACLSLLSVVFCLIFDSLFASFADTQIASGRCKSFLMVTNGSVIDCYVESFTEFAVFSGESEIINFFIISIFNSLVSGAHAGTQRAPHVYISCTYVLVLLSMRRRPPWLSVTCQYFQQFFIPNGIHILYSDYGSSACKSSTVEDCLFNFTVFGP